MAQRHKRSRKVYVHLGDMDHRPLQTTSASSKTRLRDLARECKCDRWPIKYQTDEHGGIGGRIVTLAEALRYLG